ncbi:MAG: sugar ABC transporter permease [Clostridia bacterium]|nr:sugar ABC transporter permease [Clostridia bacterium]
MASGVVHNKRTLWQQIVRNRSCYFFMSGYLIVFLLFTVIPVLAAIVLGFTNFNLVQSPGFVGLDNYVNLFLNDDVFLIGLKNTLILAAVTGPVGYILSLALAWMINELPPKPRAFLTLLFYAPAISGGAAYVWTIIFNNDTNGYLNSFLYNFGLVDSAVQWLSDERYMMAVAVIVTLWMSMGTGFLSFIAGLQGVDKSMYEAGAMDGIRNRYQELWYITLPAIKPQLLFGAVISIASSFGIGELMTQLFGYPSNNYAMHTIVLHIQDYGGARFEMGYACAVATVLFVMMIVTNSVIQKLLRKVGS